MSDNQVGRLVAMVGVAESAFRSRWRLSTLQRVDADLHRILLEQIDLYNVAMITGSDDEATLQAEAMVRGWRAACAKLESPMLPDDSYQVGFDLNTGTRVVIAEQSASQARVQALKGERVICVTPDEVARMVAGMNLIADAKSFFPDAEVLEIIPR